MGLAASQVRFLNLTARKNNLEFEGQQINQQRTTLANQSATYYNQMLTMSVPVPPSTASFQSVQYNMSLNNAIHAFSLNDTTTSVSIVQITGASDNATVVYTYTYTDNYVMNKVDSINSKSVYRNGDSYKYDNQNDLIALNATGSIYKDNEKAQQSIIKNFGNDELTASDIYYTNIGSASAPVYRYYLKSDLQTIADNDNRNVQSYSAGSVERYAQGATSEATVLRDANNRVSGIIKKGDKEAIAVEAVTVQDTAAYDDAYNQYTYETYLYQQQLEEINAKTSSIQAQDKKLELRLKQLDTEQNAISTEMDSLTNLIKKNVENTFKVFA